MASSTIDWTKFKPRLIASSSYKSSISGDQASDLGDEAHDDFATTTSSKDNLRNVELSSDGTTLLASAVSGTKLGAQPSTIQSIVLPSDLITSPPPHELNAYSSVKLPEPVRSLAGYPFYELSDPTTTVLLGAFPEHPIRLFNALSLDGGAVASYPYIRPETEVYVCPHSLLFTPSGTHFLAGADSELATFDISRYGGGPIERHKLRRHGKVGLGGQWRLKRGIISALDISIEGILAAGTFSREVGLFSSEGRGDCMATFSLADADGDSTFASGAGVSKVQWSHCGKYLLIGERQSEVIQVFDVRGQHKLLQTLTPSRSKSMMRINWDVLENGEVWAGGHDGVVRVWEGAGMTEGVVEPSGSWEAHHDPVVSTLPHPCGTVVITCSAPDRNRITVPLHGEQELDTPLSLSPPPRSDPAIKVWSL